MKIAKNSKLIFIGDSITDCGRARPVGEGLFDAIGKGYVANVEGLLGAVYPEEKIRVVNMGCSGNTTRDLKARWQADVVDLKPDWLAVLIGINDVWRHFDIPLQRENHVQLDEYQQTLDELLAKTRPSLAGLVLMSPFFLELNRQDAMRRKMDEYGTVVRELAGKYDAIFVDLQAEFDRVLQQTHPMSIAWDRVHPNQTGHQLIARAFLRAVGFQY